MTINRANEAPEATSLEFALGDRLALALRYANLGVSDMADLLGVSRETIGRWTNGRGVPKRAALLAWSAITNVSVTWLETGQAPTDRSEPDELRARRDSNPKPSDMYLIVCQPEPRRVKPGLTADRRSASAGPSLRVVGL